jgi:hypothetical protein
MKWLWKFVAGLYKKIFGMETQYSLTASGGIYKHKVPKGTPKTGHKRI